MRFAALILLPLTAICLASCGGITATTKPEDSPSPAQVYTPYASSVQRETAKVSDGQITQLVQGNNRFAFNLFHKLLAENPDTSVFSPFSVSSALAMAYAGAGGETKAQMAAALEFTLGDEVLHSGFNKLSTELAKRNLPRTVRANAQEFLINNAIWPYVAKPPAASFLDTLARHYGSGVNGLDYLRAPDQSRQTINEKVNEWTRGYITDLLPRGSVTRDTRLVLTSAIYLHAPWDYTFGEAFTKPTPFNNLNGTVVDVPTMSNVFPLAYAELNGAKLAAVPFREGQLVMAFLMPDDFTSYIANLDAATLNDGLAQLQPHYKGAMAIPKFKLTQEVPMRDMLVEMGMDAAFKQADFSGMGLDDVQISNVNHKAFIEVNEAGTTAAAATALIIGQPSAAGPSVRIELNKPFVFLIYDKATKTILFLGHVANL